MRCAGCDGCRCGHSADVVTQHGFPDRIQIHTYPFFQMCQQSHSMHGVLARPSIHANRQQALRELRECKHMRLPCTHQRALRELGGWPGIIWHGKRLKRLLARKLLCTIACNDSCIFCTHASRISICTVCTINL
jgi:hypothetical protein